MGSAFAPSGTAARNQASAQANATRDQINQQKAIAEAQQTASLQDTLDADTNRLLRTYGTRALLAGGGVRAPAMTSA
jgi:tRNA A37 threonylcarbamoyltransferase TsaD